LEKDKKIGLSVKDDRMIMLEDFISVKGKLVDQLNCNHEYISKCRPTKCPSCHSKDIVGVHIMGSYNGNLLWECNDCDKDILRFDADLTEKYLQLAKGLWTNPRDWGYVPRKKFN
tara:strand:+ start:501 stop:845 length:345 start_codon:yes stop_codon:yes gene_type:complete